MNKLYYGDNLYVIREHINNESIDLVYLDPPFKSKRDYNLLFKTPNGHESDAQIIAFEDTWHWGNQAEQEFEEILHQPNTTVANLIVALRQFLGENDMMAYLVMMCNRLLELHRVLKSTGSLYLHCDPTASHYLKIVMDGVFGKYGFRNDITWKRTPFSGSSKSTARQYPRNHDILLFYTKGSHWTWNKPSNPYSEEYLKRFKWDDNDNRGTYRKTLLKTYSQKKFEQLKAENRLIEPDRPGAMYSYKQYLSESPGEVQIDDTWSDINSLNPVSSERLGFPTQKPLALLERIILASSNKNDNILDPFCGCGTTVHAAQKHKRNWLGIDITHLAIALIEKRLREAFPKIKYEVIGTPKDIAGARDLAKRDKYQFQWWATSLVCAAPFRGKKKGADSGIDALIYFSYYDYSSNKKKIEKIIISIKAGHVTVSQIRDLKGVIEREKAAMGFFLSLETPSKPMEEEALTSGFYEYPVNKTKFRKIQVLTIEDIFNGKKFEYPGERLDYTKKTELYEGEQKKLL